MAKIDQISEKQREQLEKLSPSERAKALVQRGMQEIRARGNSISEPDSLASGKSDENGKMLSEDSDTDEDENNE